MKISKERLKQLIAEELSIGFGAIEGDEPKEGSYDHDGRMAKQNLWKMAEYAKELYNLIDDEEDLEPWVEEKIAIASFMMDSVGHYMQYEKQGDNADEDMSSEELPHDEEDEEYEFDDEDYEEDENTGEESEEDSDEDEEI